MKKVIRNIVAAIVATLCLSGCGIQYYINDSVPIEGNMYKRGFYGDLYPTNVVCTEETYDLEGLEFQRVVHHKFDLVHADIGEYVSGTLYCNEEQWEEAEAYYSNPNNFRYYCEIGTPKKDKESEVMEIPDVDVVIFEELLTFAAESEYNPFEPKSKTKTVDLPMPDDEESPKIVFYKESIDGSFISLKAYSFHIIDNQLYLVYYYDYGEGRYKKLVAVPAPKEISDYFIGYLEGKYYCE